MKTQDKGISLKVILMPFAFVMLILSGCAHTANKPIHIDTTLQNEILHQQKGFFAIPTREGILQNIFIENPSNTQAKASILLFTGGNGILKLDEHGNNKGKMNFVIRTREYLLKAGYQTVMIDAPSDEQDFDGLYGDFRISSQHLYDIHTIIAYLKKQNMPIWLMGISRGTESVAFIASKIPQSIEGIILSSSIAVDNKKGNSILSNNLDKITVSSFVIAHKDDSCYVTSPTGMSNIVKNLSNVKKIDSKIYSGGIDKDSNPCQAQTYHGFLGIEDIVLKDIIDFIDKN